MACLHTSLTASSCMRLLSCLYRRWWQSCIGSTAVTKQTQVNLNSCSTYTLLQLTRHQCSCRWSPGLKSECMGSIVAHLKWHVLLQALCSMHMLCTTSRRGTSCVCITPACTSPGGCDSRRCCRENSSPVPVTAARLPLSSLLTAFWRYCPATSLLRLFVCML